MAEPIGAFARLIPPAKPSLAILTEAIAEMNRTPGTLTDKQQARALFRILAARGLTVEARHG